MARRGAVLLALALLAAACGREPAAPRDLPREWYDAAVDAERGGRFLPERNAALLRFQDEVARSGEPVLYPHYAPSGSVALAIRREAIAKVARRRVAALLEHEAADPGLAILALCDGDPGETRAALDLPGAARLQLVRARGEAARHVTFPFLRDWAPLVRARPTPRGFRTDALVLFHGSTLNKVVDARLGVRLSRSERLTHDKYALTRQLAELYRARLDHPVPLVELGLHMDGGNVLGDGRGTCFTTQILADKNGGDRPRVERELREKVGCRRTVFLAAPQRLDLIQHVDMLLYFADPEDVVLSMPQLYESDRVREFQNVRTLLELGYRVHRLPRPTASITYTNVLTTRRNVYVPQYGVYKVESPRQLAINERVEQARRSGRTDLVRWYLERPVDTQVVHGGEELARDNRRALEVMGRLLPGRSVVPVDSDETIDSLGSWHCLSHELPEVLSAPGPGRAAAPRPAPRS